MALAALLAVPAWKVCGLLTSFNQTYKRIAIHGVREELLNTQGQTLGLPVHTVYLPDPCSNETYETEMNKAHITLCQIGIEAIGFGDLFLEDIQNYRENLLKDTGLQPIFPIWGANTKMLAEQVAEELKTILGCIAYQRCKTPKDGAGKLYDSEFVKQIPELINPCGENGEFHTFVYDAPYFSAPIIVKQGETIDRQGYLYTNLQLA